MLDAREAQAFCLAPATAPVLAGVLLGSSTPWLLVAVVSYIAAFVVGAPLFAYLRHRGCALAARCLWAAAIAGVLAALVLVTAILLAFSVPRFFTNLEGVATFLAIGGAWGLGLGIAAGITLFALLGRKSDPVPGDPSVTSV